MQAEGAEKEKSWLYKTVHTFVNCLSACHDLLNG